MSLDVARIRVERRMVIRPCACGGAIRGDRWSPAQAVAAHNRSRLHRAWWARVEPQWHPWIADELAGL